MERGQGGPGKDISQADLVGEKKTKITQDYEFIKEIGTGILEV